MMVTTLNLSAFAAESKITVTIRYCNGYTNVYLSCRGGGEIRYTTDGSTPSLSSNVYTKKVKITKPLTMKVAVFKNGKRTTTESKKINVKVTAPVVKQTSKDTKSVTYKVTAVSGASVYYTTNGTTPGSGSGTRLTGNTLTINKECTLKLVSEKKGYLRSKVTSVNVKMKKTSNSFADEVIEMINEQRTARGLSRLRTSEKLMDAAGARASELETKYSHQRPDGSDCFTVLKQYGIEYSAAGENIAMGYSSPKSVVEGWMSSESHRKNILNSNYSRIGVGYCAGRNCWVQLFTD